MIQYLIAAWLASHSPQSGVTTLYGYHSEDVYPCTSRKIGREDDLYGGNTIWHQAHPDSVRSVAHQNWPLGTWIIFRNPRNNRMTYARVTDRGPYDHTTRRGKVIQAGKFDLSYRIGVELCHSGKQRIEYWRVQWGSNLHGELNAKHKACPLIRPKAERWWQRKRARCLKRGRW